MTIMQSEWKALDMIEDAIEEYHKGEISTNDALEMIFDILKNFGWIENE